MDEPLGAAEETLELGSGDTAFLLIDVYGRRYGDGADQDEDIPDFYRAPAGDPFREIVRSRIVPAKAAAKRARLPVVYVTNYLSAGLSAANEWRQMSLRTCGVDVLEVWREPSPVLQFASIIAPQQGEPVVRKQHYSGFFETNLDTVLRGYGVRTVVAVGFDSRICLAATLTEAMYRDYRVVALRDAIGTVEYPETRDDGMASFLAVRFIEANVGYTATTEDFIAACDNATRAT